MVSLVTIETETMDTERINIIIGVDDGRWTYIVGPSAAVTIGVVAVSNSSIIVIIKCSKELMTDQLLIKQDVLLIDLLKYHNQ